MYCDVFICYRNFQRTPLGAVDFIYDIRSLELIKFLFECDFMFA